MTRSPILHGICAWTIWLHYSLASGLPDGPFEQLYSSILASSSSGVSAWGSLPGDHAPVFVATVPQMAVKGQLESWRGAVLLGLETGELFVGAVPPAASGGEDRMLSPDPSEWRLHIDWSHVDPKSNIVGSVCKTAAFSASDKIVLAGACASGLETVNLASAVCTLSQKGNLVSGTCSPSVDAVSVQLGAATGVAVDPTRPETTFWVAATTGLWAVTGKQADRIVQGYRFNAVACSPLQSGSTAGMVVAGGPDRMYYVRSPANDTAAPEVLGFEWVTVVSTGAGGVYDDEVTALAFVPEAAGECARGEDPMAGALLVGSVTVLNVRWPNGTVARLPGWAGLPMGNATAIGAQQGLDAAGRCVARAAVGTTTGVAVGSMPVPAGGLAGHALTARLQVDATTGDVSSPGGVSRPAGSWSWKWLRRERWLPSDGVVALGVAQGAGAAAGELFFVVATESGGDLKAEGPASFGVAVVDGQRWTLRAKATRAWNINDVRHIRHGMAGESDLPAFGHLEGAVQDASDNQGLWTSVVLAGALWQVVLGEADVPNSHSVLTPMQRVERYFSGMELLNNVTGIEGLMARSCLDPSRPPPAGDAAWHNSTSMPGWTWKGTTSSDEVVGHTFAFGAVSAAARASAHLPADRQIPAHVQTRAAELIRNTAVYIVSNNFTLKDFDGKPTRWGHWNPSYINENRTWSDNRGVSSLEAAALLTNGYDAAVQLGDSKGAAVILDGWKKLFAPAADGGADYGQNIVNLKIQAPCDDNYSDDELTFLPFYAYLHSASLGNLSAAVTRADSTSPETHTLAGLRRTWDFVAPTHPDLWAAIFASVALDGTCTPAGPKTPRPQAGGGCPVPPQGVDASELAFLASSAATNLRNWPLDPVQWPVVNSDRLDIWLDPEENRDARHGTESMGVLPADERSQGRWNGNPHDLDGGNGMVEMDSGAFLAPYWLGRAHGLIEEAVL